MSVGISYVCNYPRFAWYSLASITLEHRHNVTRRKLHDMTLQTECYLDKMLHDKMLHRQNVTRQNGTYLIG